MSKKLVAIAPSRTAIIDCQVPDLREDQVKVRVEYASPKHGSELAAFRNESPHISDYYDVDWHTFLPRKQQGEENSQFGDWNLGNQWVGVITEIGSNVSDYKVGDRVCGYGGIRETHVVLAVDNYYFKKMPVNMSWKNAVCFDPAQFALGGIRDSHLRAGDTVAVFGLGAIGQLAVQMAKLAGARTVVAIDPIENRRHAALRGGADLAMDPTQDDVGLKLKEVTRKLGVDVIIETSANEFALQQSLRGLAYGGTIAYVGWARAFNGGLDLGREAHFNNARIVFSRACSEPNPDYPRWSWRRIEDTCWHWLANGQLNCEDIIQPVVPFEESAAAYEEFVDQKPEKSIKLGIEFATQNK